MGDYSNNEELLALKKAVEKGTLTGAKAKRFVVLSGTLYYISYIDENPKIRLYVPRGPLQEQALEGCHQNLGHLGVDKT